MKSISEFTDRLVNLCDGRRGLRGGLQIELCSNPVDGDGAPVIDFVASSEKLDRYDEIIVAAGWELENYRRNPVFQNAHQYGDIIFTLGKALITEVRAGKLFQQIQFATEANPMARIAYGLYRGGFLNAVSVGFIPLRWENGTEQTAFRRKYLEQELLEVSAVGIPANPEALQLGLKSGVIAKSDLRELSELLKRFCEPEAALTHRNFRGRTEAANTLAGASGVRGDEAQLLRIARAVRETLRF
jgi:HK97 family phage prohead protease